jgi:hypothetical protein
MTKENFIQYLFHPENLNGQSITSLEKVVQEYPYFQIGRMLYLKNLHNENSIDYEKNLHITSAYAPSGKVLYDLIKKKPIQKLEVISEKLELISETPNTKQQTTSEILPKLEPIAILQEIPMIVKEEISISPIVIKDIPDEMQVLEKQMLREAYRTSMTIDLLEENQESRIKNQESISQKPEDRSQNHSFNVWLKVISGKTPTPTKEEKIVQQKAKSEIIDNFILEETAKAIPKPKAEFYSAEAMAKKSIQDDETFVTETLAKIYLKQGNLPKALRSYEILVVKYPEKIHIFAPLLEKIKNLLKEQKSK